MIKEIKYIFFICIIFLFIFFTVKYYISDEFEKKYYKSINNLDSKLDLKKTPYVGVFFMQLDIYLKDLSYRQSAQHSQFLLSLHPAHHNSEQT